MSENKSLPEIWDLGVTEGWDFQQPVVTATEGRSALRIHDAAARFQADGYSGAEPSTMTLVDAINHLHFLRQQQLDCGRKMALRHAEALELAITAVQNMLDAHGGGR